MPLLTRFVFSFTSDRILATSSLSIEFYLSPALLARHTSGLLAAGVRQFDSGTAPLTRRMKMSPSPTQMIVSGPLRLVKVTLPQA
ncbi:uncharacterized protein SCHCODRAFT_02229105 [Schizophyllum commune H4-8]|uniref:Expressed protein n=1 Tax=Schizophyllum commune (strain H4-8 / FGSC 9210) TaxID=578458 RepID=D8Q1B5_SCHCM|nr:uncharacterized protein SCHCODRAFT_02229105 [Schizophyllum commune H4-8]KAI5895347.1 hypothetical protein SCHCODRAFT_02229105 [Schizophyllum commune H4-8]